MENKLEVKDLRISFRTISGKVQAVRGINFDLKEGENEIEVKLLRRTENLKFGMGFRICDGESHWHRTKWHTDIF